MLYLIGLGLGCEDDLTERGKSYIKSSEFVYLDSYTSILTDAGNTIKELSGKELITADRELVEQTNEIVLRARDSNVSFLVVGDPLSATTHTDILLRAIKENVPYKVVHNASILTAIGICGLYLYNFGMTVSIPFWDEFGKPHSFYDKIERNFTNGLHSLCLLDIKVKEQSLENLLRGRKIYEPPRYMTCSQAAWQISEITQSRVSGEAEQRALLQPHCLVIGLARVGSDSQRIIVTTLEELSKGASDTPCDTGMQIRKALGDPLHSMIIPSVIQPLEGEFLMARYTYPTTSQPDLPIFILPTVTDKPTFQKLIDMHNEMALNAQSACKNNSP